MPGRHAVRRLVSGGGARRGGKEAPARVSGRVKRLERVVGLEGGLPTTSGLGFVTGLEGGFRAASCREKRLHIFMSIYLPIYLSIYIYLVYTPRVYSDSTSE